MAVQSNYKTFASQSLGNDKDNDLTLYLDTLPNGSTGYLVLDPEGSNYELVYYESKGANFVTIASPNGRGLSLTATTATTVDANVKSHGAGTTVIMAADHLLLNDLDSNRLNIDGSNISDAFDAEDSNNQWRLRNDGGVMKLRDSAQPEVTLSEIANLAGVNDKFKITINDTTAGIWDNKIVAGDNITFTTNNPGGNETVTIDASSQREGITVHATYTPAYLTSGASVESNFAVWNDVTDGEFAITIDGVAYEITGVDFTGDADMDDVVATLQAAIRAETGGSETVTWGGGDIVINSGDTTSSSAITVTSTIAVPVGTDISGAGGSNYLDSDSGNGTVTAAVLDPTQDSGKVALLNASGLINASLLAGANPVGSITIWTTNTAPDGWALCDGSNIDATSDTTFADLYAVIGTTFGGTGEDDFDLPDIRGRFVLGQDDMGGTSANRVTSAQADSIGGVDGAETHTLTVDEIPSHSHDTAGTLNTGIPGGSGWNYLTPSNGWSTDAVGGDQAHNNMPPYMTLNYIIKK